MRVPESRRTVPTHRPRARRVAAPLSATEVRRTFTKLFEALRASDAIIAGGLNHVRTRHKSDGSEVTAADRGAERALRGRLARAFPRDALLGEEYGGTLELTGRCWTIDPIDGTASYVLGLPLFGTLLSLLIDGEPVLGCIRLTALRELTYAASGHGCWLRRDGASPRRVRVAAPRALARAQVGLTSFKQSDLSRPPGRWRLAALTRRCRIRAVGDCVQYALVCRGVLDAAVDPVLKPWDIGALAVCVREAGGAVRDLRGEAGQIITRTSMVAASSAALCSEIAAVVSPS